jgi:hypothetical protein
MSSMTARPGAGSGEVPGRTLSLRLHDSACPGEQRSSSRKPFPEAVLVTEARGVNVIDDSGANVLGHSGASDSFAYLT